MLRSKKFLDSLALLCTFGALHGRFRPYCYSSVTTYTPTFSFCSHLSIIYSTLVLTLVAASSKNFAQNETGHSWRFSSYACDISNKCLSYCGLSQDVYVECSIGYFNIDCLIFYTTWDSWPQWVAVTRLTLHKSAHKYITRNGQYSTAYRGFKAPFSQLSLSILQAAWRIEWRFDDTVRIEKQAEELSLQKSNLIACHKTRVRFLMNTRLTKKPELHESYKQRRTYSASTRLTSFCGSLALYWYHNC